MKTIVGIDPGLNTGMCKFCGDGADFAFVDGKTVRTIPEVVEYIRAQKPDAVVMENYIVGKRPARPKEPLKVIGVVEHICLENGVPLFIQPPSVLSKMLSRAKELHTGRHVQTSCAHVLYYLEKQK